VKGRQRRKNPLRDAKCLFTNRNLWAIYLGQYCITALTYFFITWFPIYLIQGRGMTIMQAGGLPHCPPSVALPAVWLAICLTF
jgi:ACS family glucarate transporter-like MFS transporter